MTIRNFFLKLLQEITKKPRYRPEIQWSNKIWISNFFRAWEYLFGREYGIKPEASSSIQVVDGKLFIRTEFYTLEALLAHIEVIIRTYLSLISKLSFRSQNLT